MSVYITEEPGNSKQIFPSEKVLLNVLHISVDDHSDKALLGMVWLARLLIMAYGTPVHKDLPGLTKSVVSKVGCKGSQCSLIPPQLN